MGADALSDVLRAVRLTGAVFVTVDVSPPWSAPVPSAATLRSIIMPSARPCLSGGAIRRKRCGRGAPRPTARASTPRSILRMIMNPERGALQGIGSKKARFWLPLGGASPRLPFELRPAGVLPVGDAPPRCRRRIGRCFLLVLLVVRLFPRR